MLSSRQKFVKNLTLPLAMLVFVALFAVDFFFAPLADSSTMKFIGSQSSRISDDLAPRIDQQAAMVVKEGDKIIPLCQTLPAELWILLLAAYIFLMFFNLFYDFKKSDAIHWFWESLYTVLALGAWYFYDTCHSNIWFPLYVLKLGVIIYLVYLWLYHKKKEIQAT